MNDGPIVLPIFGNTDNFAHILIYFCGWWCICILANVGMASWKGRRTPLWAILGFFLGPFSTLVLLFLGSRVAKEKSGQDKAEEKTGTNA